MSIFIPKYCKCGKYQPTSTKGILNDNCRNCGGAKKPLVVGKKR